MTDVNGDPRRSCNVSQTCFRHGLSCTLGTETIHLYLRHPVDRHPVHSSGGSSASTFVLFLSRIRVSWPRSGIRTLQHRQLGFSCRGGLHTSGLIRLKEGACTGNSVFLVGCNLLACGGFQDTPSRSLASHSTTPSRKDKSQRTGRRVRNPALWRFQRKTFGEGRR